MVSTSGNTLLLPPVLPSRVTHSTPAMEAMARRVAAPPPAWHTSSNIEQLMGRNSGMFNHSENSAQNASPSQSLCYNRAAPMSPVLCVLSLACQMGIMYLPTEDFGEHFITQKPSRYEAGRGG